MTSAPIERSIIGKDLLESIWYNVALRILDLAKNVYSLDSDQHKALKEVFAKPNDYVVITMDE